MHFFKIQAFEWTAYIKCWKFREDCLIFISYIHIYPEQEYIMNVLTFYSFMVDYMCDQKPPKILQTVVEGKILRIVEQPYPLAAKACKNQNL